MKVSNALLTRFKRDILLLLMVFIISGCTVRVDDVHRIMLDDNIAYVLQPIPEKLMNTGIQALFTVKQLKDKQQGKEKQFLMQVEMTQSHLLVSGMTVEGLSLFTLDWNTELNTLNFDKKIAIEPLRILAELQLVLWPLANILNGLEQAKMTVISINHREISSLNEVIYQINQQDNISRLVNLKRNYSLEIEELERWPLSGEINLDIKPEQSLQKSIVEN